VPPDAFSLSDPSDSNALLLLTGRLAIDELIDEEFAADEFVDREFSADVFETSETREAFLLSITASLWTMSSCKASFILTSTFFVSASVAGDREFSIPVMLNALWPPANAGKKTANINMIRTKIDPFIIPPSMLQN
jgi:hypothetical protein